MALNIQYQILMVNYLYQTMFLFMWIFSVKGYYFHEQLSLHFIHLFREGPIPNFFSSGILKFRNGNFFRNSVFPNFPGTGISGIRYSHSGLPNFQYSRAFSYDGKVQFRVQQHSLFSSSHSPEIIQSDFSTKRSLCLGTTGALTRANFTRLTTPALTRAHM